jgi:hypothetical protein
VVPASALPFSPFAIWAVGFAPVAMVRTIMTESKNPEISLRLSGVVLMVLSAAAEQDPLPVPGQWQVDAFDQGVSGDYLLGLGRNATKLILIYICGKISQD